jgi:hypothetical protein
MTTEPFFALALTAMIAMFFGFVVAFSGYRFFLVLLPIWGFFYGFGFGAHTVQALLNQGFLATITSWLVGFFVGALFAILSYLFYVFGVALLAGTLGYALGVGLMMAVGFEMGFLPWVVGIVVSIAFAVGAIVLNIQKWIIIVATALIGAGTIIGTFLYLFGGLPSAQLTQNPVRYVLQNQPFWLLVFLVVAVLGFVAQYQSTRSMELDLGNRIASQASPAPASGPAV